MRRETCRAGHDARHGARCDRRARSSKPRTALGPRRKCEAPPLPLQRGPATATRKPQLPSRHATCKTEVCDRRSDRVMRRSSPERGACHQHDGGPPPSTSCPRAAIPRASSARMSQLGGAARWFHHRHDRWSRSADCKRTPPPTRSPSRPSEATLATQSRDATSQDRSHRWAAALARLALLADGEPIEA